MNSKLLAVAVTLMMALVLSSCGGSSGSLPTPIPPVIPELPDPVQPPDTSAPDISFLVSGSVLDNDTDLLVGPVSLTFRENGQLATNLVDVDGNPLTTLESPDGVFLFTAAEGASLGVVSVSAVAEGYLNEATTFDFTGVSSDTRALVGMVPVTSGGVAVESQQAAVDQATVATDVTVPVSASKAKSTAAVTLPGGTQLQDADGNPIAGSSVDIQVAVVDVQQDSSGEGASAAAVIPAGLNPGGRESVQIPVGVTDIEIIDDQGNQVTNFSQPITVSINVPNDGTVAEGEFYPLSSYDQNTGIWQSEGVNAIVGSLNAETNLFPVTFQIDHLTFFAVTGSEPACQNAWVMNFSGDPIPESGLNAFFESSDMDFKLTFDTTVSNPHTYADVNVASSFIADAAARVTFKDNDGNVWFDTVNEVSICGEIDIPLNAPVSYVSENVNITATCANDTTVSQPVVAAIVQYGQPNRSTTRASNQGSGAYSMANLVQGQTYNINVAPRFSDQNGPVATVTSTITADGTAETIDIPVACAGGTGAG